MADNNGWIRVSDSLPDFDVKVLVYWKLAKDKKEGGYWDMIEIGNIGSITTTSSGKNVQWCGEEYRSIEPLFWQPLPEPPTD